MDVAPKTALYRKAPQEHRTVVLCDVSNATRLRSIKINDSSTCAAAPRRRPALAARRDLCSGDSACCFRHRQAKMWPLPPPPRPLPPRTPAGVPPRGHQQAPVTRRDRRMVDAVASSRRSPPNCPLCAAAAAPASAAAAAAAEAAAATAAAVATAASAAVVAAEAAVGVATAGAARHTATRRRRSRAVAKTARVAAAATAKPAWLVTVPTGTVFAAPGRHAAEKRRAGGRRQHVGDGVRGRRRFGTLSNCCHKIASVAHSRLWCLPQTSRGRGRHRLKEKKTTAGNIALCKCDPSPQEFQFGTRATVGGSVRRGSGARSEPTRSDGPSPVSIAQSTNYLFVQPV